MKRVVAKGWCACGLLAIWLAGCAPVAIMHPATTPPAVMHGRLLVIGPAQRWQAMFDLKAPSPDRGWLRISHAASGRIIELRWDQMHMQWRDNQAASTGWRPLSPNELARHGILLRPDELAAFLTGHAPTGFQSKRPGQWFARRGKSYIRVERTNKRLAITDLSHGRRAVILLQ